MSKERTKRLVITAMFIAITYIFTVFVNIRLPFGGNGGLIHLGNVPLFLAAILYGKRVGAVADGEEAAAFLSVVCMCRGTCAFYQGGRLLSGGIDSVREPYRSTGIHSG